MVASNSGVIGKGNALETISKEVTQSGRGLTTLVVLWGIVSCVQIANMRSKQDIEYTSSLMPQENVAAWACTFSAVAGACALAYAIQLAKSPAAGGKRENARDRECYSRRVESVFGDGV